MIARAPMGECLTMFGTTPESQAIVQNEGLGIRHSIQRALWNAYYAYAGHTTIHGWGSVICFPAPGRHYGAASDWGFTALLAKSTPNTWQILGETLTLDNLRWTLEKVLPVLCYSDLKIKLQRIKYAIDRIDHDELIRSPGYRPPVVD
jgi:hypothetical protein